MVEASSMPFGQIAAFVGVLVCFTTPFVLIELSLQLKTAAPPILLKA